MKTKLSRIKSGAFSRGMALAKVTVQAGSRAASHAVGSLFAGEESQADRLKQLLIDQMGYLARELGQLKGSLMKVGQMLSVVGEHFLPPEANQVLKSLQSESPPLEWGEIEKVLKRQLGKEALLKLQIDHEPYASASLGQVHRASSGEERLALKIQYPGVDEAIEGDLRALKSILALAKILPDRKQFDRIFDEVRSMLHHEVDYERELQMTDEFRDRLTGDSRFIVPRTFSEFSTKRVLATSFEEGSPVDAVEVLGLSQERRDRLGEAFFQLYLREIFEFGSVQTDPHLGNYRVRLGERDQWVLLDFGAVRKFDDAFLAAYRDMLRGAFLGDPKRIIKSCTRIGFLRPDDSQELLDSFVRVSLLFAEPVLGKQPFSWGSGDLAKRVAVEGKKLAFQFRLRPPPSEIIFFDRKMAGVFTVLHVLKSRFDARQLIDPYLRD